ncbi:MAG: dockerin type I domain-containing protein [candidate division Zixibacteria bacterium]|nr:dockerin type I domain-containing protein [candidate division Zixibacteria bacterium]
MFSTEYYYQRISDTIPNLWLAQSNRMAIGRPFADAYPVPDDQEMTETIRQPYGALFPGGALSEYLFGAGLWVGGIKGNDTMVSHAFDFAYLVPELIPQAYPEGAIQTLSDWADLEHIAVAYDTLIAFDTLYRCLVGDCHDWYPLGIQVTSHSYAWESPPYDNSVLVTYTIKNISTTPIEQGWAGIYADCDIGSRPDPGSDDLTGFIPGVYDNARQWVPLNVGYSVDIDGDPGQFAYDSTSANGAFGVQILDLNAPDYRVNFNWWVGGNEGSSSWGPRQLISLSRDLGGSFAAPYGDSNKYFVMSFPEIDYNQIESSLLHPNWAAPDDSPQSPAMGSDTRFLISAGPFDLQPGEDVVFTVAYLAADNVVRNPYVRHWLKPDDPASVSDYYEMLHLDGLKATARALLDIKENGLGYPPPGPPADFRLTGYDDNQAFFVWTPKIARDLAGYKLMRKSTTSPWEVAAEIGAGDSTVAQSGLDPQTVYTFAVVSVDQNGSVGKRTPEISLLPSAPHPPLVVTGSGHRGYPFLQWSPSEDASADQYRLYRIDDAPYDTIRVLETPDTNAIDLSAVLGRTYHFYVTAVSIDGWESPPSMTLRLTPFLPTRGILVIDQNSRKITSNLIFDPSFLDSLAATALAGMPYATYCYDLSGPLTVADLSRYSTIIVSSENLDGSLRKTLADTLRAYLAGGGTVILTLGQAGVDQFPKTDPYVVRFNPGSLFRDYLMVDSCVIGPLQIQSGFNLTGDLIGAEPSDPKYPRQTWDSLRVNQFGYRAPDGLPFAGYLWARPSADVIFTYVSSNPDSTTQGQTVGIAHRGENYSFYLLNFPLSLMNRDSAAVLLRQIVLKVDRGFILGDVTGDGRLDIADITAFAHYLYGGPQPPAIEKAGDTDCDDDITMNDLLIIINFLFHKGLAPDCQP